MKRILSGTVWINSDTGKHVGVRARLHFLLDDLYPAIFRSLFGAGSVS